MINTEFIGELENCPPDKVVTAVLTIQPLRGASEPDRRKNNLLDKARAANMRVNPLPGFPQVIVQAQAVQWQQFMQNYADLLERDNITVEINSEIAQAPPEGDTS